MFRQRVSLLAAAVVLLTFGSAAAQGRGNDHGNGPPAHARGGNADRAETPRQRDLSDSVRRVARATRGRVLSAEAMQFDGRMVNRIKVLDDSGRVRVYVDDPTQSSPRPTRDDDD